MVGEIPLSLYQERIRGGWVETHKCVDEDCDVEVCMEVSGCWESARVLIYSVSGFEEARLSTDTDNKRGRRERTWREWLLERATVESRMGKRLSYTKNMTKDPNTCQHKIINCAGVRVKSMGEQLLPTIWHSCWYVLSLPAVMWVPNVS